MTSGVDRKITEASGPRARVTDDLVEWAVPLLQAAAATIATETTHDEGEGRP